MTNVNRRCFDELALVLKRNHASNHLILQVADVLNRSCHSFKREYFAAVAGYRPPAPLEPRPVLTLPTESWHTPASAFYPPDKETVR